MTIYHADSHAIIPDGMRRTADAYQSSPAVSVAGSGLIFVSGQVGGDEAGQPIAYPEAQFVAAIDNLREIRESSPREGGARPVLRCRRRRGRAFGICGRASPASQGVVRRAEAGARSHPVGRLSAQILPA